MPVAAEDEADPQAEAVAAAHFDIAPAGRDDPRPADAQAFSLVQRPAFGAETPPFITSVVPAAPVARVAFAVAQTQLRSVLGDRAETRQGGAKMVISRTEAQRTLM